MPLKIFMTLLLFKKKGMLYTAGLIVSHLQLLFVVVVVLTNHNKPRWLTCDPTWRACGEYITMPSEIGFPTLTSDASLNQKTNKQTSHE